MKALSVRQPWASLILSGRKTIETRTWFTEYRGPVLICSSNVRQMSDEGRDAMKRHGLDGIPRGVALCLVDLIDCRPMSADDEAAACCSLYDRAFSWSLANVRPVRQVPLKGQLLLFNVPDNVVELAAPGQRGSASLFR